MCVLFKINATGIQSTNTLSWITLNIHKRIIYTNNINIIRTLIESILLIRLMNKQQQQIKKKLIYALRMLKAKVSEIMCEKKKTLCNRKMKNDKWIMMREFYLTSN